jgi:hypothetical protein
VQTKRATNSTFTNYDEEIIVQIGEKLLKLLTSMSIA